MNNNKQGKICSVCGKPWTFALRVNYNQDGTQTCEHDSADIGTTPVNKKRKENLDRSVMAERQATEYRSNLPRDELITIAPPKGDTGKRSEVVPKKIVESIQDKLNNQNL